MPSRWVISCLTWTYWGSVCSHRHLHRGSIDWPNLAFICTAILCLPKKICSPPQEFSLQLPFDKYWQSNLKKKKEKENIFLTLVWMTAMRISIRLHNMKIIVGLICRNSRCLLKNSHTYLHVYNVQGDFRWPKTKKYACVLTQSDGVCYDSRFGFKTQE